MKAPRRVLFNPHMLIGAAIDESQHTLSIKRRPHTGYLTSVVQDSFQHSLQPFAERISAEKGVSGSIRLVCVANDNKQSTKTYYGGCLLLQEVDDTQMVHCAVAAYHHQLAPIVRGTTKDKTLADINERQEQAK